MRVLVVDDDFDVGDLIKSVLSLAGDDVLLIHDGLSALRYLASVGQTADRPDVMILDVMLGDLDGARLLADVRGLVSCPVVAATAYYGVGDTESRVRDARFDGFIRKPIRIAGLKGYLDTIVRSAAVS